ncbi:hypothetical protein EX30DRAFT_311453 [Ascodesmis nigricans]|uniref:FHA domain-containing protein n=1 Tax=Ascodesmis nigricans TaxID=341454 RepID=A0A4V3SHR2_9PEZI|nr:hypothetical protein EX30DRAFT_311453 [Ascodesmis nigricans]
MFGTHSPSPNRLVDADLNVAAGTKRRAPSLLPAFEPSSSPPRFKRQKSRPSTATILEDDENLYPGSSILPSSPPPAVPARPTLQRTQSSLTERSPLSAVPSITLPENGEEILLGRSSKSSHVGLSANRLISRVHIRARYTHTEDGKPKIEVTCTGWNGVTIHCQGLAWDLQKGDVFNSETEHAEIMLDIQDSRVLLAWPGTPPQGHNQSAQDATPRVRVERSRSPSLGLWDDENSDPTAPRRRKLTPVSPTPARRASVAGAPGSSANIANQSMNETFLEIYEDDEDHDVASSTQVTNSHSQDESEAGEEEEEHELPLPPAVPAEPVYSFVEDDGLPPFKDSGFESDLVLPPMGRFSTAESLRSTPATSRFNRSSSMARTLHEPSSPIRARSTSISPSKADTIQNHLTNQLAFSRIATVPLSDLFNNLPVEVARTVTKQKLYKVLGQIDCIGEVKRHGKDAAGKPLESEFYYILEKDADEGRKMAVSGKRGVRNCRKTHKQYYWKKPKRVN